MSFGPKREENQQLYANTILLHTAGDPSKTIADLRAAVASVDPNLPLLEVKTIEDQISNLTAHDELISTLTGLFSLLGLSPVPRPSRPLWSDGLQRGAACK